MNSLRGLAVAVLVSLGGVGCAPCPLPVAKVAGPRGPAELDKGCGKGSAKDCWDLATMVWTGEGAPKDDARASRSHVGRDLDLG